MDHEELLEYLDKAIRHWRGVRRNTLGVGTLAAGKSHEMALHYIDAYQSVRTTIFGATLHEDEE